MFSSYYFVKKYRMRKKIKLYKLFLSVTVDLTSIMYSFILLGYLLFAFYQVGEMPAFIEQSLIYIENFLMSTEKLLFLFAIVPVYFTIKSFNHPGVLFSSAEQFLTILPYSRQRIWVLSCIDKLLRVFVIVSLILLFIYMLTDLSLGRIGLLMICTLLLSTMMTIIQWKLYQLHTSKRILFNVIISVSSSIYSLTSFYFILLVYSIVLCGMFLYSLRHLFSNIAWQRVIATSDYHIWNMRFISQATKVRFKKEGDPGLWYRFKEWKRPFPYEISSVYGRLWYVYIEKEIGIILQMTGALFLFLSIASYFNPFYYGLAVAITIHIQAEFMRSLFKERVQSGLIQVLPWNLTRFRATFLAWAILLSLLHLIPIGFYSYYYFSSYFLIYFVYIGLLYYLILYSKLQKSIAELNNQYWYRWKEGLGYFCLIILLSSVWHPYIMIIGYVSLCILVANRRCKT